MPEGHLFAHRGSGALAPSPPKGPRSGETGVGITEGRVSDLQGEEKYGRTQEKATLISGDK